MSHQHRWPVRARVLVALALATMLAGCAARLPATPPSSGPVLFAVVTWNMHAGRGDLPRLVDDLTSGRLTGAPPDEWVILLQEAIDGGTHDVMTFADERNLSAFYAPVRTHRQRTSGNAILSTSTLVNAQGIPLPRERQHRGAVAATVELAGTRLFVVSTHLENRVNLLRGGPFTDAPRGRQADALLAALPLAGYGIAGGDLNTFLGPTERAWRAFAERFQDTPADGLAPTFRDRLVLDHLFFDLPREWQAHRWVSADRYGSDHNPVLAVVSVRQGVEEHIDAERVAGR